MIGSQIGNYRLIEELGQGGMGAVYLARHPEIGLDVAIKILTPELLGSQMAISRFLAEAKVLTRIQHPNVVRIFDFGHLDDGRLYYVMEALKGKSLQDVLQENSTSLNIKQVLTIVEQLCPALQAAHDLGIIHRDLKPSNIFVTHLRELSVKILDFGIAKLIQSPQEDQFQTQTGMVIGTPGFLAPEQATGQSGAISPQTDLYALGTILYVLLSGHMPFSADNNREMLFKQVTSSATPITDRVPTLPNAVAQLIHRCLAKDPAERPPGAMDFLEDFRSAVANHNHSMMSVSSLSEAATRSTETKQAADVSETTLKPTPKPAPSRCQDFSISGSVEPRSFSSAGRFFRKRTVLLAAGIIMLLAGGIFIGLSRSLVEKRKTETNPSKESGPQPTFYTVRVKGGKDLQCQVRVDNVIKHGLSCAEFKIMEGKRVMLLATSPGFEPFKKSWTVTGNRTIQLSPLPKGLRHVSQQQTYDVEGISSTLAHSRREGNLTQKSHHLSGQNSKDANKPAKNHRASMNSHTSVKTGSRPMSKQKPRKSDEITKPTSKQQLPHFDNIPTPAPKQQRPRPDEDIGERTMEF